MKAKEETIRMYDQGDFHASVRENNISIFRSHIGRVDAAMTFTATEFLSFLEFLDSVREAEAEE